MSQAYPSDLSREQYEFLSDLIPEAKPGGRPREVQMWAVLNAIFYVLLEGVRWRALPGDFPAWQTMYTSAASVGERAGGRGVLKRVKQMGKGVLRLHTIWVDGGFDGEPYQERMDKPRCS